MWGCGLKFSEPRLSAVLNVVTPYVGVWIEIHLLVWNKKRQQVTPYVGVWIEM